MPTYGTMAVDWENRVDFDRLRRERLARAKALLAKSEMGALLCFDMNNVRYLTATHIGTWAQDKANRFTLLPQNDEPILWDFGSAARHHQLHCPWLGERSRPGISMLRGAITPEMGRAEDVARKIKIELEMRGLHKQPLGIDIIEPPVLFALQKEGLKVVDGQALMSEARVIKTQDEITLLNMSAMMVDAAYDDLYRYMKPGVRENEAVGLVSKKLYDLGSEYVEAVNAISGERCNPHPHVFSDRVLRPGDPVYTTSSIPIWVTAPATTAASPSATLRTPWWTLISAVANTWTPPLSWFDREGRPRKSPPCGPRRRSSASLMKKPVSLCNTAMGLVWPSGKGRSSAAWYRSSIRMKSSRAWYLRWRRSGLPPTVGARPASRKK